MTRLSAKTIINKSQVGNSSLPADFFLPEIQATIRDKGQWVIYEKSYLCPCKAKVAPAHLSTCKNCGGSGWIFANPTKTKMIITGLVSDNKLKEAALREWGMIDSGTVKITALDDEKLTFMDRVTLLDATAEHQQLLYPDLNKDDDTLFAFTHYDILSIDAILMFVDKDTKLTRMLEPTDYSFADNVVYFTNLDLVGKQITIRYRHWPVFHVFDVLRESMTSTSGQFDGQQKLVMPVHALARRAHLTKEAENLQGDRVLNNSWLTSDPQCIAEELSRFQRQVRYSPVEDIFAAMTDQQKADMFILLGGGVVLSESGGVILVE